MSKVVRYVLIALFSVALLASYAFLAEADQGSRTVRIQHGQTCVNVFVPEERVSCIPEYFSQDAIDLAKICTNENSFEDTNDCRAIYEVLTWRAANAWKDSPVSFGVAARRYSRGVFFPREGRQRLWITELDETLAKPDSWPYKGLPWDRRYDPSIPSFRERWLERLRLAQRIVDGRYPSPCVNQPIHWGARYGEDLARARRAGWREASCGSTNNAFWMP